MEETLGMEGEIFVTSRQGGFDKSCGPSNPSLCNELLSNPVYAMSCFRIPDGICNSLNSLMSNFWWGQRENERKVHWRSWIRMCSPKKDGGMGFHDLRLFNKALLSKQGWKLIQHPNSLIGRIYKAKYYPHSSFLEAKVPNHSSFIWRSLASARDLIGKGSRWRVGNGNKIRIWQDNWIPR